MNRKQFLATITGVSVASTAAKMVLYDDGYGKSLVTEDQANGVNQPQELSIAERCEKIRREAEQLAGTYYDFGYINRQGYYKSLIKESDQLAEIMRPL